MTCIDHGSNRTQVFVIVSDKVLRYRMLSVWFPDLAPGSSRDRGSKPLDNALEPHIYICK